MILSKFAVRATLVICLHLGGMAQAQVVAAEPDKETSFPKVKMYLDQRRTEFDQIPADRKTRLKEIAAYVRNCARSGQPARLTFICTHNSRRSQMSQIWAMVAANDQNVAGVEVFSGGTEVTAFNPRAIAAIERAGLKVDKIQDNLNSKYAVRFDNSGKPLTCFSKVYSDAPNPTDDFCAVMTCAQADKSCPLLRGSSLRVALPFDDPKVADNTPEEAAKYDERCSQVSREMLYLFSQVAN